MKGSAQSLLDYHCAVAIAFLVARVPVEGAVVDSTGMAVSGFMPVVMAATSSTYIQRSGARGFRVSKD